MSINTLFEPPAEFDRRIAALKRQNVTEARLLLQVELGFALMEHLELDDEPVTAVWAILSGMFIRHPRLENLSEENRRAIANARQIVPFSARFNWLNALRDYIRNIPRGWRNYDFDIRDLDNQIIEAAKNLQHQNHQNIYERCLSATLNYRRRKREQVEAGTYYQFESSTKEEPVRLQVKFTQPQVITSYPLNWFNGKQERSAISINLADLEIEARFLDRREAILAELYNWSDAAKGNWERRFSKLNYHKVLQNNIVEEQQAQTLTIDGFTHVAGMVASGKSTLSLLLASHVIRNLADRRITIVVGDTQSAIKIANQINWWFCDDPENDNPIAVPILGRSRRDNHLQGFSDSSDYLTHLERGQSHWGERWLSTVCPLQAIISPNASKNILNGKPLIPGTEPCHKLKNTVEEDENIYFCPLLDRCPSQQAFRDMPTARVWITTPGSMAQGGMPYHYELRPIRVGELVYEQSDIVVFDEADTIIEWFDKEYAEQVTLTAPSKSGVFDEIGIKTEESYRQELWRSPLKARWSAVQRDAQTAINITLTLLSTDFGINILQKWVSQGYFTPHVLFYKLARRLAGLEEYNSYPKSVQQLRNDEQRIQPIMEIVDEFLKDDPLLRRDRSTPATARLLDIVKDINNKGESATDDDVYQDCQNWITTFFPNTQSNLDRKTWDDNSTTSDFTKLSGFIDKSVPELLHYFSVGKIPQTQKKKQDTKKARELSKTEHIDEIYAANIAYKHQQMVEMLPFFVRSDFQTEENLKALCRVPHYLRLSPAYTKGNIIQPYPMHLGMKLIDDLLCILDLE